MVGIKTTGEQISILCHNGTIFDKLWEKLDWPSKDTLESERIQPVLGTDCRGYICKIVQIQQLMGVHMVSAFHPFIFQKSGKSTIIRNLAVPRHFVAYLVFISSIRVDPGPRNRGPTSLLALKIRTPVANTGKLRSIGQVPVIKQV
jgi:hypothetical protein